MSTEIIPNFYHGSLQKRLLDIGLSLVGVIISLPLFVVFAILIKLTAKGPVFFKQKRLGKNAKMFQLIKFRTMVDNAPSRQWRYRDLNEADGPVFKIRNDPRYTAFGKLLARTGLDELPQSLNVIRGEMSLVGPRPLPVDEAKKLNREQKIRELVKPGITSSWVISGTHSLKFNQWMELDRRYVEKASLLDDLDILMKTALMILKALTKMVLGLFSLKKAN